MIIILEKKEKSKVSTFPCDRYYTTASTHKCSFLSFFKNSRYTQIICELVLRLTTGNFGITSEKTACYFMVILCVSLKYLVTYKFSTLSSCEAQEKALDGQCRSTVWEVFHVELWNLELKAEIKPYRQC